MAIYLLDDSLKVEVYYDPSDSEFEDSICMSFVEDCPEDEKLFFAGESNIYITPVQACQLIESLTKAVNDNNHTCIDNRPD